MHFLNENALISLKFSLKFVPKNRINNIPAMVQIMAWRWPGDKPLSEPMMVSLLMHICVTRPQWVKLLLRPSWQVIVSSTLILGHIYSPGLPLIPAWRSNYFCQKVWDGVTYLFTNFNSAAVKVWEWISNFIQHFNGHVMIYPCWDGC